MSKYDLVISDIGSVFNTLSFEIYPDDYSGDIQNEEKFARYSILFGESESYNYDKDAELSGYLMIRLFSAYGYAGKGNYELAGLLDTALEEKFLSNGTHLGKSTLTQPQTDPVNNSLVFSLYRLPFKLFT